MRPSRLSVVFAAIRVTTRSRRRAKLLAACTSTVRVSVGRESENALRRASFRVSVRFLPRRGSRMLSYAAAAARFDCREHARPVWILRLSRNGTRSVSHAPLHLFGRKCDAKFFQHVFDETSAISNILSRNVPMSPLTAVEQAEFDRATTCRNCCLLYTSPSPRDRTRSRMPSSA